MLGITAVLVFRERPIYRIESDLTPQLEGCLRGLLRCLSGFGVNGVSFRWAVSAFGQKEYGNVVRFVRRLWRDFPNCSHASRTGLFHRSGVGQLPKLW
jgi:hypothetical protein